MDLSLANLDLAVRSLVVPLGAWILLSGIDDLFVDAICLLTWLSSKAPHTRADEQEETAAALSSPQKRIAIVVPLWQEDGVIAQMVNHNVEGIEYLAYDVFLGAYPNDAETLAAVRALEERHRNVHVSVCGHAGPTSKADCLNWIYRRMLEHEREHHVRFEVVVTHDAEDVIHPYALHWLNYYADIYDMVQVPVLPLRTAMRFWTHGIYCDEFSEFQMKDMPGRQILNGFVPSNGVGTGYTRWALEKLASDRGQIFAPECLTEDYENGLRLHLEGCPQMFLPVRMTMNARGESEPVATREYFPQTVRAAIKQRTRWVTGIALQSWQRHGWKGGLGTRYWLWRDRKGLVGNPVSMLTTLMFLYGLGTLLWSRFYGLPWGMAALSNNIPTLLLMSSTTTIQFVHLGVRAWCTSRVYGWRFATGVPLRALLANYINFRATMGAIYRYGMARIGRRPLVWLKTTHSYPVAEAQEPAQHRPFGEILVGSGRITRQQLDWALARKPKEQRLGEFLVGARMVTEEQVYQALSLQGSIPLAGIDPRRIRKDVARALPAQIARQWNVIPFQVTGGFLFLAASELPSAELEKELSGYTKLHIRMQLVTGSNLERLRGALLS